MSCRFFAVLHFKSTYNITNISKLTELSPPCELSPLSSNISLNSGKEQFFCKSSLTFHNSLLCSWLQKQNTITLFNKILIYNAVIG